jgi:hypothetical protein
MKLFPHLPLAVLGWLFTLGVLLHNTEEALYLPAWSSYKSKWCMPVEARVFRLAAGIFSALLVILTTIASLSHPQSVAAYLMAGYVLAMLLNVLAPHALATLFTRSCMPGTASAVLLNLPLGSLYLCRALSEHSIEPHVFIWSGPLTVLTILASIPALFALARKFHSIPREKG